MKFIGQFIQDFIARFRNDVYLEDLTEAAQGHVIGVDAAGKLYKQDVSSGDMTGVDITVGDGLDISQSNTTGGDYTSTINLDLTEVGVSGSANQLLTDDGDGTVTSEPNLTFDGSALSLEGRLTVRTGNQKFFNSSDNALSTRLNSVAQTANRGIQLPDQSGIVQLEGVQAGKQLQVFACNFVDDISTTKHYIPFKDINEQTVAYQEEVSMIAPCDGRIVSVTLTPSWNSTDSLTGSGNLTVGIETIALGNNTLVSSWNVQETEALAFTSADDNHAFHFAFTNAKHFDSTEKFSISFQASSDPTSSGRFWIATVVIEWDWSTFLGQTSAEFETTP